MDATRHLTLQIPRQLAKFFVLSFTWLFDEYTSFHFFKSHLNILRN